MKLFKFTRQTGFHKESMRYCILTSHEPKPAAPANHRHCSQAIILFLAQVVYWQQNVWDVTKQGQQLHLHWHHRGVSACCKTRHVLISPCFITHNLWSETHLISMQTNSSLLDSQKRFFSSAVALIVFSSQAEHESHNGFQAQRGLD